MDEHLRGIEFYGIDTNIPSTGIAHGCVLVYVDYSKSFNIDDAKRLGIYHIKFMPVVENAFDTLEMRMNIHPLCKVPMFALVSSIQTKLYEYFSFGGDKCSHSIELAFINQYVTLKKVLEFDDTASIEAGNYYPIPIYTSQIIKIIGKNWTPIWVADLERLLI